jgi:hypothetical protein
MKPLKFKNGKIVTPKDGNHERILKHLGGIEIKPEEKILKVYSAKNIDIEILEKDLQSYIDKGWSLEPIQEEKKEPELKRSRRE